MYLHLVVPYSLYIYRLKKINFFIVVSKNIIKKLYNILMKVIFYSNSCVNSIKLLEIVKENNLLQLFKLVNMDINKNDKIKITPTILDTELIKPMEGLDTFNYVNNLKYFNNPTFNTELLKIIPPNPIIPENELAIENETSDLKINKTSDDNIEKPVQNTVDKKHSILAQIRRR